MSFPSDLFASNVILPMYTFRLKTILLYFSANKVSKLLTNSVYGNRKCLSFASHRVLILGHNYKNTEFAWCGVTHLQSLRSEIHGSLSCTVSLRLFWVETADTTRAPPTSHLPVSELLPHSRLVVENRELWIPELLRSIRVLPDIHFQW